MSAFRLGFVEGFYGTPWSWSERKAAADFMSDNGYSFYLYAPKGDVYLRRRWREPWPKDILRKLKSMTETFHSRDIQVGMGLSLYEFHLDPEEQALKALRVKISEIQSLGVDHVSILFDDMRGDLPDLAKKQIRLVHAVRFSGNLGISMCPTFYSLDPVLDRLFGPRPPDYLDELGAGLDPSIEIFWTGEKICSKSHSLEHIAQVERVLKRRPLLWDNYPVNDTESMSRFLRLRPFEGRPAQLKEALSGHLINPMLQATLSRIPALTLTESYVRGAAYEPQAAFKRACRSVVGDQLAPLIERDVDLFQDHGLIGIASHSMDVLKREYQKYVEHPAAREVLGWLDGEYCVTREQILAQQ